MREIRDGHEGKEFEGVELVRVPRLNVKSLRIEQMVQRDNDLPIVHKLCSCQDHAGQGVYTEGDSLHKLVRTRDGSYIATNCID